MKIESPHAYVLFYFVLCGVTDVVCSAGSPEYENASRTWNFFCEAARDPTWRPPLPPRTLEEYTPQWRRDRERARRAAQAPGSSLP